LGGILHSYTLCIAIALALAFFYPILAFPFFLGYSSHLFLDAFTPDGIKPFWPFIKKKSTGKIDTGGKVDLAIFTVMIFVNIALLAKLFF
jgi:inner membrane protein